jgi:xanthine dehydrogenase accessory factor
MSAGPNEAVESFCRNWDGAAPYARATIVRTEGATAAKAGAKAIVTARGDLIGWIGGGCIRGAVLRACERAIQAGQPRLIHVRPKGEVTGDTDAGGTEVHMSHCSSKGSADIFIEPVLPKPLLMVIGASYSAKAIAELAAKLDFELLHVGGLGSDAKPRLSELEVHPGANRGFAVVATQGSGDYAALKAAMGTGAPYVAFVASLKKARALRERLAQDGYHEDALARLHAPAGLDIGAETPAEIAIAILAEIVSLRRSKRTWPHHEV